MMIDALTVDECPGTFGTARWEVEGPAGHPARPYSYSDYSHQTVITTTVYVTYFDILSFAMKLSKFR